MEIVIPVSLGELYDKISILIIKKDIIKDLDKLQNIQKELDILQDIAEKYDIDGEFHTALYDVNYRLWNVEDKLRENERIKLFDNTFIELARNVYHLNDKRNKIKREINLKYGSIIVEEKQYPKYE